MTVVGVSLAANLSFSRLLTDSSPWPFSLTVDTSIVEFLILHLYNSSLG